MVFVVFVIDALNDCLQCLFFRSGKSARVYWLVLSSTCERVAGRLIE